MNNWVYATFTIFVLLQFWFWFRSSRQLIRKTLFSAVAILTAAMAGLSYGEWMGWPKPFDRWDQDFKVDAVVVKGKKTATGTSRMYVWLEPRTLKTHKWWDVFSFIGVAEMPRAYELPWDEKRREQMRRVQAGLAQGMNVYMRIRKNADGKDQHVGDGDLGGSLGGRPGQPGGRQQVLNGEQSGGGDIEIELPPELRK